MRRFLATALPSALFSCLLAACGREGPAPATQLPEVTVAFPVARATIDCDGYVGQFEAVERVDVRPRVSGYLRDIHFVDGALVTQGQLLFTIDARPFEADRDEARGLVAAAESQVQNARTELERARPLAERGAASRKELEGLEAALRTAEATLGAERAALRTHELDVEFTQIVAPTAGRVSYRRVDRGNAVVADSTVLTTIVTVDPVYFVFQGSEALYLKYRRADAAGEERAVRIRLQDETEHRWHGRLDFVDNAIDPSTGTIRGRAVVSNPGGFLTPGMFGHMELQASDEYMALLLPDSAIATRGADRIVYVVDEGGLVGTKAVELGPLSAGLRVIRSGLAAGDRVVIDGQQRAQPGQAVQAAVGTITDSDAGGR